MTDSVMTIDGEVAVLDEIEHRRCRQFVTGGY
jgi:hypothetical protein